MFLSGQECVFVATGGTYSSIHTRGRLHAVSFSQLGGKPGGARKRGEKDLEQG